MMRITQGCRVCDFVDKRGAVLQPGSPMLPGFVPHIAHFGSFLACISHFCTHFQPHFDAFPAAFWRILAHVETHARVPSTTIYLLVTHHDLSLGYPSCITKQTVVFEITKCDFMNMRMTCMTDPRLSLLHPCVHCCSTMFLMGPVKQVRGFRKNSPFGRTVSDRV